jgi:hypothetical protein
MAGSPPLMNHDWRRWHRGRYPSLVGTSPSGSQTRNPMSTLNCCQISSLKESGTRFLDFNVLGSSPALFMGGGNYGDIVPALCGSGRS